MSIMQLVKQKIESAIEYISTYKHGDLKLTALVVVAFIVGFIIYFDIK